MIEKLVLGLELETSRSSAQRSILSHPQPNVLTSAPSSHAQVKTQVGAQEKAAYKQLQQRILYITAYKVSHRWVHPTPALSWLQSDKSTYKSTPSPTQSRWRTDMSPVNNPLLQGLF